MGQEWILRFCRRADDVKDSEPMSYLVWTLITESPNMASAIAKV